MTIEEITNLRKQEQNRTLRSPNCYKQPTSEEERYLQQEKQNAMACIVTLTQTTGAGHNFFRPSTVIRTALRKNEYINSFKGLGTLNHPYIIDSKQGKGKIVNAHELFEKKEYPNYVESNKCFANSLVYAYSLARDGVDAKLVSGIFDVGIRPILHSVVEIPNHKVLGDCIVDFNYNLAISKNLYCSLFNFEELNNVDAIRLVQDRIFSKENRKKLQGKNVMYINFAYDDILDYISNKDRQNQDIEFVM